MKTVLYSNDFVGKLCSCSEFELKRGDLIVFESPSGIFLGNICSVVHNENKISNECSILRIATKKDIENNKLNSEECIDVLQEAKKAAHKLGLDMIFVEAVYTLDKKRLYISFVADNRVDFRELAKRIAQKYHSRIEFRQIGVRDKAKKIGGIGPCGLMLCCNTFLSDFESVSINMAKNQLLALNPNKINGVCGRLKCCLKYENDVYKEKRKDLPKIGSIYENENGKFKVIDIDILQGKIKLESDNRTVINYTLEEYNETIR